MKKEQLVEAVVSAINSLEEAVKALADKDEEKLSGQLWQASADSEHALFLFSLTQPEEPTGSGSSWKSKIRLKKVDVESALALTNDLLRDAKENIQKDGFQEAYEKTWMARGYLLKAQQIIERAKKEKERQ